jgi:G3E family GTPase
MSTLANKLFTRDATRRVPVTVLTGALGSGKSTLVNHILNNKQGAKICVIENEFGQVGIDDSLIADRRGDKKPTPVVSVPSLNRKKQHQGAAASKAQAEDDEEGEDRFKIVNPAKQHIALEDELVVMLNGCICCTVRQDLVEVLKRLLITEKHPIDAIVIETTGLADPAPVAQTFFVDPDVSKVAYLDAIITVVDAFHVRANMDRERPEGAENEIVEQLAFADRIILNKMDLLLCADELEGIVSGVPAKAEVDAAETVVPAGIVAADGGAAASPPPYRSQAHGNHSNGKIDQAMADAALLDAQTTLAAFNSKHVPTDRCDGTSHGETNNNKLQTRVAELARCIRGFNPLAEIIPSIGSVVP